MAFELTNNHRRYLGLELTAEQWDKEQLSDECFVYFHGDVIKKLIIVKNEYYYECQMNEKAANNRSILLPKTNRGKEKKLTAATIQNRSRYGNYFSYDKGFITIANVTTQKTYYCSQMASANCEGMNQLQSWLDNWVSNSSEENLLDMDNFSKAERMHCKFKEGDFKYNSIGWGLDVTRQVLEACIREKSNQPYWNQMSYKAKGDLRNPEYAKEREMVLKQFEE